MVTTRKATQKEASGPSPPALVPVKQDTSEPSPPACSKRRGSPTTSLTKGQGQPKRARRAATGGGPSTPADSTDATQQGQHGVGEQPAAQLAVSGAGTGCGEEEQVTWSPALVGFDPDPTLHTCPSPKKVELGLPTSANAAVWQEYGDDTDIFNVGLIADTSAASAGAGCAPVAVAAVDLLAASDWFRLLVGMRSRMGGGASGREGRLRALPLPLRVPRSALLAIVQGLYEGRLQLSTSNVEAVLRVADALQVCCSWVVVVVVL